MTAASQSQPQSEQQTARTGGGVGGGSGGPPRLTHLGQQTPQQKGDQRGERTERFVEKERLPRAAPLELVPAPPAAASTPKPSPSGNTEYGYLVLVHKPK